MLDHRPLVQGGGRGRGQFVRGKLSEKTVLSVGRAAWWIPVVATRKDSEAYARRQKAKFSVALKDFLQHVSFHGYGNLVEPGRGRIEKCIWLLFHILALHFLLWYLWHTSLGGGQILETTVHNQLYPIEKVTFPAISICSNNRISNASALQYAEELSKKDPLQRGANYFFNNLKAFGNYYYDNADLSGDYDGAMEFQRFLDIFDTEDEELFYNSRRRMRMLTPRCDDLLLNCHLAGQAINCLEEFRVTITARGFCCTFNYDGKRYGPNRTFRNRLFGPDNGLIVILNSTKIDFLYKTVGRVGFAIAIYSPRHYPDASSGGVRERFAIAGLQTYLPIKAKVLNTVNAARYLSPNVRKCRFSDEMDLGPGHPYNFNDCIIHCRIRSILVLCKCLLYNAPDEFLRMPTHRVFCTLQHAECLRRYEFKWLNVITKRANVPGLELEMEDALNCPDCLPSCSETLYRLSVISLPLTAHNLQKYSKGVAHNISEVALATFYFSDPSCEYFLQILKESWFEIFSTVGNICSSITGFSLIGICEVVFFLVMQFMALCRDVTLTEQRPQHRHSIGNSKQRFDQQQQQHQDPLIILP